MDSKTYGEEYLTYTHTDSAKLINALAEIERLTELCKEYRENGDRLMRVADEYKAEIERLKEDLIFVERWAVHHAAKPHMTPEQALSCIAHYPAIKEITKGYTDGVLSDTFDPYAAIERKDAALRVAASALIDSGMYARKYGDELLNVREALATIKEAVA